MDPRVTLPVLASPPDSPVDTLAEPARDLPPLAHTVLVLEPDNVRNATLRSCESLEPMYHIRSDARGDRTDVRAGAADAAAAPLASIHRKALTPTVTLHNTRRAIARWLKSSFSTGFPVSFEADGEMYQWRVAAANELSLYAAADPSTPIAWFVRPRKGLGRAYLALEPAAERVRDDVVVSFLVVEEMARIMALRRGQKW